jgi:phospholipid transport system substrate-binding protein
MLSRAVFTRRSAMAGAAGVATWALAPAAFALNASQARTLVDRLTNDVMTVINSGKTGNPMFREFERIFAKYADVPIIARSTLGIAWRSTSANQQKAYVAAFRGYMARKYGKRFKEFIGSEIKVTGSRKEKSFYVVDSTVRLAGTTPFQVNWLVSDKSGSDRMFNLVIEGINMMRSEREEIGLMLDQNGGDVNKLITALKTAG